MQIIVENNYRINSNGLWFWEDTHLVKLVWICWPRSTLEELKYENAENREIPQIMRSYFELVFTYEYVEGLGVGSGTDLGLGEENPLVDKVLSSCLIGREYKYQLKS